MRKLFAPYITAILFAAASQASALDIHFYPSSQAYAYQLDGQRRTNSVLIQNIAILNDGASSISLENISLELMAEGRVTDTRILSSADLSNAAAGGAGLQQAGLWDALRFQFGGERLVPDRTVLSPDLTLDPGEAVIVSSQVFAFRGARDALRVRVNGGEAVRELPISLGQSKIAYAFPLNGTWYVGAGSSFHTGHRWSPMEEFAFDFVRTGADGRTYRGKGTRFIDYYAYKEPVFAAASGKVIIAINDEGEDPAAMKQPDETVEVYFERLQQEQFERIEGGARAIGGSQVMIDHGNGEYSFYAHLKPGSLRVKEGDVVDAGVQLGLLGSSGNSTEPHLHFQVCNAPDPLSCAGIPVRWADAELLFTDPPRALQSGDLVRKAPQ